MNLPAALSHAAPWQAMRAASFVILCASLFLSTLAVVSDVDNWIQRLWSRYCASIERKLYKMFIWTPGHRVVAAQILVILGVCVVRLFIDFSPMFLIGLIFVAAAGPEVWLSSKLHQRKKLLDQQVDGFLVALANALKSRPNIADAIASVTSVIDDPMRQEVELAVKHMRMGSTLDQALLTMSGRASSRQLDAAVSSLLVGRQVGGNVPEILETTAASIREMARLEGVVRTKTAEGKAQLWVLAAIPFGLILLLSLLSPGYFDPMSTTAIGYVCTVASFVLWAASIAAARKILRVDI